MGSVKQEIKIVCLSDTHGHHRKVEVPQGDLLIFSGDFMTCGRRFSEVRDFGNWFSAQPHKHKILVGGNHDRLLETNRSQCLAEFSKDVIYLEDTSVIIDGWKIHGSPVQPWFCNWSWNVNRGPDIKKYWDKIPMDTDILITHGPPKGIGDLTIGPHAEHVGCDDLLIRMREVNPELHIFGHIHNGYGLYPPTVHDQPDFTSYPEMKTHCMNVSICDEEYEPVNGAIMTRLAKRE